MKRIIMADDHDAVRYGIRAVLEQRPGWNIVAEAADGKAAPEAALEERPDVAGSQAGEPSLRLAVVERQIRLSNGGPLQRAPVIGSRIVSNSSA